MINDHRHERTLVSENNSDYNDIIHGDWRDEDAELAPCAICQRDQPLFFHCTGVDITDRAECRTGGDDAVEEGVWLCTMCEDAVHRWMADHPGAGAADKAVNAMYVRLAKAIFAPPRPYRRRPQQ